LPAYAFPFGYAACNQVICYFEGAPEKRNPLFAWRLTAGLALEVH
jgi:hypothetical protein